MINLFLFKEMDCGSFRYAEIIYFFLFSRNRLSLTTRFLWVSLFFRLIYIIHHKPQ